MSAHVAVSSTFHSDATSVCAPAVLIYAPGADDRVAAWHGRKMLARWQSASSSGRPVLLRAAAGVGHGGGTAVARTVERFTDIWTFLFWQLGIQADGTR